MRTKKVELKLIYKQAHSFHKTTGIELDDLIGEASLAYCEALSSYKKGNGTELSTWIWVCIENHLTNYTKKMLRYKLFKTELTDITHPKDSDLMDYLDSMNIRELTEGWSECEKEIVFIIISTPLKYMGTSREARARLKRVLRNNGWKYETIWASFQNIKRFFNEK